MQSKITIHTAPNFKPCIKVQQRESQEQDVRDTLVKGFIELLNHRSNTAHIQILAGYDGAIKGNDLIIIPIEDEIEYFKGQLQNKFFITRENDTNLYELYKLLESHLISETNSFDMKTLQEDGVLMVKK